jgi:hypothetical protein
VSTFSVGSPSRAPALEFEGGPAATRRPHVFAVGAQALPLPSSDSYTIAAETEIALLMTPGADELLDLRTPRGTMGVGMRFVIRRARASREHLFLVRVLGVTELRGMHFDLVNARLEQPIDRASSGSPTTNDRPATSAGPAARPRPAAAALHDPRLQARSPSQELPEFAHRACANTIDVGGLSSTGTHVSVTLLTPVRVGEQLILSAPRDGAELSIVRRDALDPQRYGARFTEPKRGATTLLVRLDLDEAEHMRRRRAQIEEIPRGLDASAGPFSPADIRGLPNGRMGTRSRRI